MGQCGELCGVNDERAVGFLALVLEAKVFLGFLVLLILVCSQVRQPISLLLSHHLVENSVTIASDRKPECLQVILRLAALRWRGYLLPAIPVRGEDD